MEGTSLLFAAPKREQIEFLSLFTKDGPQAVTTWDWRPDLVKRKGQRIGEADGAIAL